MSSYSPAGVQVMSILDGNDGAALDPARAASRARRRNADRARHLRRASGRRARGAGFARGERVPLDAEPAIDFVVSLWACLLAGAAAMTIDPRLGERERLAQHLTADGPPSAPDVAMIVHTSGTTGAPRPVEL